MKRIILASSSPRRKNILKNMGLDFEIIPSSFEEIFDSDDFDYKKIEDFAYNKAKSVFLNIKFPALIIGADTVVVYEDQILGKPKNVNEAFEMLKKLSGNVHFVVTSVCIFDSESSAYKILSTTSYVEFFDLSDEKIIDYIENFSPLDKAGAYGIQELPEGFVKSITGSFENIIGLCPVAVESLLKKI